MKKRYALILLVFLAGCQNEELFEQVEETMSLSSQSDLSKLISRLNQNPTAFDDFIDNSNSFSLEFPYRVTVNSQQSFNLNQFSDYQPLIDELSTLPDDYNIAIRFPITVSLPNYESVVVRNQSEFNALKTSVEGSTEINCLNYNFPLEINVFNVNNSSTTRRVLQNKAQFYNLIQNLQQTNGFYEIIYPVTVSIQGQNIPLLSNQDLNAAIQTLAPECFNPALFTTNTSRAQQFITFITSGRFIITRYLDSEDGDQTGAYASFRFFFNADNSILVQRVSTGESFTADWELDIDDNELIFELDFNNNDLLEELDDNWVIDAFANPDKIRLTDTDSSGENVLIFQKI